MNINTFTDTKQNEKIGKFSRGRNIRLLSRYSLENRRVLPLSEMWIQSSEKILDRIKSLEEVEGKDRLELVRSMRFMLGALQRSLLGWMQWVNNPDIMTRLTQEDLKKMNKKLSEFVRSFVEYDLEVTKLGAERGLKARKKVERKRKERAEIFYV